MKANYDTLTETLMITKLTHKQQDDVFLAR